jgi:DNA processing protein
VIAEHNSPAPADADGERFARIALSFVAEPGDRALGALVRCCGAATALSAIAAGQPPTRGADGSKLDIPGLDRAVQRWAARLQFIPANSKLAAWSRDEIRTICPGETDWPTQLDILGDASPIILWVQGATDLRFACLRSVSIVGSRAATAYGNHVATEMAALLAERGWTVISGGAFGIDGSAHRGALAARGLTVAALAGGISYGYPRGHHELFASIAAHGTLVSEWPPDRPPNKPGFLVRNRLIAALSRGTVVVEAGARSGALSTARHALGLGRPVMAVPGPVTSATSAGCHELIRNLGGTLVTRAEEVIEEISPVGEGLSPPLHGPVLPRDLLDRESAAVLEAVPARGGGHGHAQIAVAAGLDVDTVIRCLGTLAAAGFVERSAKGWRLRSSPAESGFPDSGPPVGSA